MIIGTFTYDPKADSYRGSIVTFTAARSEVIIRPNVKGAEREPDYRVIHERDGSDVELGAAWKRTSDKTGPFLSVIIDDPALLSPLNAALFRDREDTNLARLAWTRPRAKPAAPEPAASQPSAPEPLAQEPERPATSPRRNATRRKPQHG